MSSISASSATSNTDFGLSTDVQALKQDIMEIYKDRINQLQSELNSEKIKFKAALSGFETERIISQQLREELEKSKKWAQNEFKILKEHIKVLRHGNDSKNDNNDEKLEISLNKINETKNDEKHDINESDSETENKDDDIICGIYTYKGENSINGSSERDVDIGERYDLVGGNIPRKPGTHIFILYESNNIEQLVYAGKIVERSKEQPWAKNGSNFQCRYVYKVENAGYYKPVNLEDFAKEYNIDTFVLTYTVHTGWLDEKATSVLKKSLLDEYWLY